MPFVAATTVPFLLAPFAPVERPLALVLATILQAAMGLALVLVPWRRIDPRWQAVPPLGWFVIFVLLREALGPVSGIAVLGLLPVLWFALHGTRRELVVALAGTALTLGLPIVLHEGYDGWPQVRSLILVTLIGAIIGPTVQGLVATVRARAAELAEARADAAVAAVRRRQVVELNDGVIQRLVVARLQLEAAGGDPAALRGVEEALREAQRMVDDLLGEAPVIPGDLRRSAPAETDEPVR